MKDIRWTVSAALCALLVLALVAGCTPGEPEGVFHDGQMKLRARTAGRYFEVYDESWSKFLIKGMNIGASMPGKWFGELAIPKDMYARWFDQISRMHANTILVYTLMKPWFYDALTEFNRANPGRQLWLMQQVWPDEQGAQAGYFSDKWLGVYENEIKLVVDALNGNADIPERTGKAWGTYRTDVMPYVLGIVIGREITNIEVINTTRRFGDKTTYQGDRVRTTGQVAPIEVWSAQMCDRVASYLNREYSWGAPVGFVSWPTLDPLVHLTENTKDQPRAKQVDDSQVLDPRHLAPGPDNKGGIFGMYQVYAYYPEFMYREPSYMGYSDEYGVLRYGGYLKDFMNIHPEYPAVVGEFGLPTSISSSHDHPEGLSQGKIEEGQQGRELARMARAIVREGYAGSLVFEWADEWAKQNWATWPYMVPFDRHVLWHNVTDPEQNFGLLDFEPARQPWGNMKSLWRSGTSPSTAKDGEVLSASAMANEEFLYLEFEVKGASELVPDQGVKSLSVGISTLGKGHGTTKLPVKGLPELPVGAEFLLRLGAKGESLLLNRPDYSRSQSKFWAAPAVDPRFEHCVYLINREQVSLADGRVFPALYTDQSVLRYGDFNPESGDYDSLGNWYVAPGTETVMVRIPWGLLNVSDPSSNRVLYDTTRGLAPGPAGIRNLSMGGLDTLKTPGFLFFAAVHEGANLLDFGPNTPQGDSFAEVKAFNWRGWQAPKFRERLKRGYDVMKETYGDMEAP